MESVKVHRNRTDKVNTSNESDVGKGLPLKAESALSSTSDDRNGESICNMKSFDSFGSDHDTSVSSTSESNLSDVFDEVAGGKDGIKNVPQCLLRDRLPEQNGMDEIKFSFLPEYLEVGQRPTKTNKKMFLSKRMSNKIKNLSPLDSPEIRATKLDFDSIDTDTNFVSEDSKRKVISFHHTRRAKKQHV